MTALPREVVAELKGVAHIGKADRVIELVEQAAQLIDEEAPAEAIALLERAKPDAPRSATVRELLGLAHYQLGRFREAVRELAAYRRMSGRHDQDHLIADAERGLGRPEKALQTINEIPLAELDEEARVEVRVVGAGALADLGRHDEAVALLQRGPVRPREVEPHHLRLWYALADALESAGRRRDARGWWDQIYAEDPEFFDVARRRLGVKGKP